MPETHRTRVLIIGSGPAGYTAAIYAARASLSPILVAGLEPGGQLTITTDVENYPGFADVIQGPWLMEQMAAQAEHVGTRIVHDLITRVDFSARPFRCVADSGDVFLADAVIIATGAQARWLGIESEQRLQGRGVSACATCDGFFYRGKAVAVIGGGNTAVEEALYLTHHADSVTLVHRRDALRAEKILQAAAVRPSEDQRGLGQRGGGDRGRRLARGGHRRAAAQREDRRGRDRCRSTACSSPSAIRRTRRSSPARWRWTRRATSRPMPGSTRTSVEGVFAAGDVQDKIFRQAVTAAGTGCMAALEAEKWLAGQSVAPALAAD